MTQNRGSHHPLILCVFGIHNWKLKESSAKESVSGGRLGNYLFLPNTVEVYECTECRKQKRVVRDYRGDVIP
jgi:hypothetical protein